MKNLGRTIDRILKIDPDLQAQLAPIKNKWKRYPKREMSYWKQLVDVLNTEDMIKHPDREKIRDVVITKRKPARRKYTFKEVPKNEKVIGIVPENIADRIRRYDRASIEMAKKNIEARMTSNIEMIPALQRENERIELQHRKVWFDLKDHFRLWQWDQAASFFIRINKGSLVVTIQREGSPTPPPNVGPNDPIMAFLRVDPELMKRFFKHFGIDPPPGLFSGEDG